MFLKYNNTFSVVMSPYVSRYPGTGSTMIPHSLLKDIVKQMNKMGLCEYSNDVMKSENSVEEAESIIIRLFGSKLLEWSHLCAKLLRDENLSSRMFDCFCPKLSDSNGWLSSGDIGDFMKMLEKLEDKKFHFFGPFPVDYIFSPARMPPDAKRLGFVVNTSTDTGSHWVAMYFDLESKVAEYFDSFGRLPSKQMTAFVNSLVHTTSCLYGKTQDVAWMYTMKFTNRCYQDNAIDCGIYCVKFLVDRIMGICDGIATVPSYVYNDDECKNIRMSWWN